MATFKPLGRAVGLTACVAEFRAAPVPAQNFTATTAVDVRVIYDDGAEDTAH